MQKTIRILVDEEYGYRTWVWTPQQSDPDIFIGWFESVDAATRMDAFHNPTILPGVWKEVEDSEEINLNSIDGHAYMNYTDSSQVYIGDRCARWASKNTPLQEIYP